MSYPTSLCLHFQSCRMAAGDGEWGGGNPCLVELLRYQGQLECLWHIVARAHYTHCHFPLIVLCAPKCRRLSGFHITLKTASFLRVATASPFASSDPSPLPRTCWTPGHGCGHGHGPLQTCCWSEGGGVRRTTVASALQEPNLGGLLESDAGR